MMAMNLSTKTAVKSTRAEKYEATGPSTEHDEVLAIKTEEES